MNIAITAFLTFLSLYFGIVAYYINRTVFDKVGGFLFSPLPFILINYFLIFIFRPVIIVCCNDNTLDYEVVDCNSIEAAIQMGLLSLCAIFLPYLRTFKICSNLPCRVKTGSKMNVTGRLFYVYLLLSILVLLGLFLFGSAINNTKYRMENPSEYKFYFLFILIQRFHFVASVLVFFSFIIANFRCRRPFWVIGCLAASPVLTLFAAGRGAAFYLLIALGVSYIFAKSLRLSLKHIYLVLILGLVFLGLNFILGAVRIVVSSSSWTWSDILDLIFYTEWLAGLGDMLALASWDYSVFDVLIRILDRVNEYTYGQTNLQYLLAHIPRALWPDKPYDQGFMLYVTSRFYKDVYDLNGATFAGTIVGEGYLNFGVFGVLFYSYIFSVLLRRIYMKCLSQSNGISIVLYSIAFPFSQQVIRGGLDAFISFFITIYIPLLILSRCLRSVADDNMVVSAD